MYINKISSCNYTSSLQQRKSANQIKLRQEQPQTDTVSFKGTTGTVVGGILGLAALTVLCPAVVGVGLGALGLVPGFAVGHAVEEKIIDCVKESKKKK